MTLNWLALEGPEPVLKMAQKPQAGNAPFNTS